MATFENDAVVDWMDGLQGKTYLSYVEVASDHVVNAGDGYLEAPEAQEAIAAVETVALGGEADERAD